MGVNMAQFPTAQHLASLAGLCPGNHESAGKRMSGTMRAGNKWLRLALCQAAWAVTRKKDCYLSAQFRRLAERRGMKRAVMAVVHSMLIVGYTILKTGQSYHERPRALRPPASRRQPGWKTGARCCRAEN
jgi:transposase